MLSFFNRKRQPKATTAPTMGNSAFYHPSDRVTARLEGQPNPDNRGFDLVDRFVDSSSKNWFQPEEAASRLRELVVGPLHLSSSKVFDELGQLASVTGGMLKDGPNPYAAQRLGPVSNPFNADEAAVFIEQENIARASNWFACMNGAATGEEYPIVLAMKKEYPITERAGLSAFSTEPITVKYIDKILAPAGRVEVTREKLRNRAKPLPVESWPRSIASQGKVMRVGEDVARLAWDL